MMKKILFGTLAAVILLIAGISAVGFVERTDHGLPAEAKGGLVSINGTRLRVYQKGRGPDILMIHGCPGSLEDWDPVMDELAKNFRVTVYDRPGYGYSSGDGNRFSLEYNAGVALKLIKVLGLKEPLVVGHSYGAATALALAVKNPPQIRGFVLCASPGYPKVHEGFWNRALSIPYFGEGLTAVIAPLFGARLVRAGILSGFDPNQSSIPEGFIALRSKMWLKPSVMTTRAREYMNLESGLEKILPFYKDIRKKVLIVQGKSDEITKSAWKLHEDIPNSELIVFDGVGHYLQFARPAEVAAILRRAADPHLQKRG